MIVTIRGSRCRSVTSLHHPIAGFCSGVDSASGRISKVVKILRLRPLSQRRIIDARFIRE